MVEEKTEEKLDDRRSFVGPNNETEYFIGTPNAEHIRGADWQYSKIYTRCLSEGIPTSAELMDILRKRDIIGEDFDKRVVELSQELNNLIIGLELAEDNNEKSTLAVKVAQAREALFQWNQRLSGPMSNTCEQIADDARLEFLTASMIQYEDGSKVWENHNDFLSVQDQAMTMKSRYEVMLYLQGYDSDFLEKTPEATVMKEIEQDIIQKAAKAAEEEREATAQAEAEAKKQAEKVVKKTPKKVTTKKPVAKKPVIKKTIKPKASKK